ncbi:Glutamine amidotransferase class-I [Paramagnetospirillum magnetotacticum MS-1]|uniref:Glutamine amidotransferase class-I n=1 Tax=Paramagnetospirillum magnetotacticum MS-1 TaxID=272627 RepID=A0A0C2Z013_PARME|nr:glutamine amidotransferase [Paramagnetospirillum magnetotacticum]KIM00684.1 Glutamine amidotransferase class-I [Paramagnetospirillum magnetotacticum MS-1]
MKTCVAIRHVAFEDLGSFQAPLEAAGYSIRYVEAGLDDISALEAQTVDLLVVLGGPIGAYDDGDYPFLRDELRLIEARLRAGRPVIGICLGAQVMARALGARVYPNGGVKEIGWSALDLTEAGRASPLAALTGTPVLHWHGDTFDLPEGATLLASTPITRHQAFSWGRAGLGLQFHVEATRIGLERWFIGHAGEIGATPGLSVAGLRAATGQYAAGLEAQAPKVLSAFLSDMM